MALTRKCGLCGAAVTKRHDGEEPARGLGHWHCTRGCEKRAVQVTRRVDSGKENEKAATDSIHVLRDIPVVTEIKQEKRHGNEKEQH